MSYNLKIHFIPPMPKREMKVAIYSRVSTNSVEQLKSLTAQVSAFIRLIASTPAWLWMWYLGKLVQIEQNFTDY